MTYAAAEVIIFIISYGVLYFAWVVKDQRYKPVVSCFLCAAFSVYIVGIVHFTLFYRDVANTIHYELALFWSYKVVWEEFSVTMWWEIVNNILLFVPMGVLLPLMFEKCQKLRRVFLITFLSSFTIEACQLVFKIGLFEFDDMFNNTLGGCLGYGICRMGYLIWKKPKRWTVRLSAWIAGFGLIVIYFLRMRSKF